MADPLAGCDTYDILPGALSVELPRLLRQHARMDGADAAQMNWSERARWLMNEASYELERLGRAHG